MLELYKTQTRIKGGAVVVQKTSKASSLGTSALYRHCQIFFGRAGNHNGVNLSGQGSPKCVASFTGNLQGHWQGLRA